MIASIVECVVLARVSTSSVTRLSVPALENAHWLGLAVHLLQDILLRDLLGLLLILLSSSDGELLRQVGIQRIKGLWLLREGSTVEQQLVLLVHCSSKQSRIGYLELLHELLMTQHWRLVLRHGLSVQTGKVLNILLHRHCLRLLSIGANLSDLNEGSLHRWRCNARLGSRFAWSGLLLVREKGKSVRCIEVLHRCGWLRLLGRGGGLRRRIAWLILGSTLILRLRLGSNSVLGRDLVILEKSFEDLHALIFLLRLKKVSDVLDLVLNILALNLVLLAEDESGLDGLHLSFQESKSVWICDLKA